MTLKPRPSSSGSYSVPAKIGRIQKRTGGRGWEGRGSAQQMTSIGPTASALTINDSLSIEVLDEQRKKNLHDVETVREKIIDTNWKRSGKWRGGAEVRKRSS